MEGDDGKLCCLDSEDCVFRQKQERKVVPRAAPRGRLRQSTGLNKFSASAMNWDIFRD